jgi:hypothetical protein
MADKIPIKALYNTGVPYAFGEFTATDTISQTIASYDSTGNSVLTGTTVDDCVAEIETQLTFFNAGAGSSADYFETYCDHDIYKDWYANTLTRWTKLECNIVLYDTALAYNNTTFQYTIPTKGIWKFSARAGYDLYTAGWFDGRGIDLFKNNALFKQYIGKNFDSYSADTPGEEDCMAVTYTVELDVGDVIDVRWKNPATGEGYIEGGQSKLGFAGYLHRELL